MMRKVFIVASGAVLFAQSAVAQTYDPNWLASEVERCVKDGLSREHCHDTVYLSTTEKVLKAHRQGLETQRQRDERLDKKIRDIPANVATEEAEKYEMVAATMGSSAIDICVQAGITAQAFLQAKDVSNYGEWKQTELEDCTRAGVR